MVGIENDLGAYLWRVREAYARFIAAMLVALDQLYYSDCIMTYTKLPYTASTIDSSLSISPQGWIGLSKVLLSMNGLGPSSRAQLYLDEARKSMAIEFTTDEDPSAYPIAFTKQSGGFINAKKFFQQGRLDLENFGNRYSFRYAPGKSVGITSAKQDLIVVDLEHSLASKGDGPIAKILDDEPDDTAE